MPTVTVSASSLRSEAQTAQALRERAKRYGLEPEQVLLRSLVIEDEITPIISGEDPALMNYTPEQIKAGIILFATFPILIVYPFIQRYFVKGAMLGSLKR